MTAVDWEYSIAVGSADLEALERAEQQSWHEYQLAKADWEWARRRPVCDRRISGILDRIVRARKAWQDTRWALDRALEGR